MNPNPATLGLIGLITGALLLVNLTGCDLRSGHTSDEPHVLRMHDVSQLQIEELDAALAMLLQREDLPLRGNVERIDQSRIVVNGSEFLQEQIARLLDDLALAEASPNAAIERNFRLQFWVLTLTPDGADDALPPVINDLADAIRDQFPGHGIGVRDFIETFGSGTAPVVDLISGAGTHVSLTPLRLIQDGAHISGRILARAPAKAQSYRNSFSINRTIRAGQPLILGRAHGGAVDDQVFYRVLVARMDWTD